MEGFGLTIGLVPLKSSKSANRFPILSVLDAAQQMKVQDSQTSVTGEKGYCMIRATHSVHTGTWYYEATITDHPEGSATRIGWSQLMGESFLLYSHVIVN